MNFKPKMLLVLLMICSMVLMAQISPKVSEIKRLPDRYLNEVVLIEGYVTQYVEGNAQTTDFYFIKDDWGGIIKVRTSKGRPEVGKRYKVIGPVSIDTKYRETFVSEENRELLEEPVKPVDSTLAPVTMIVPDAPVVSAEPAAPVTVRAETDYTMYILIAAIAVVLLILLVILLQMKKRKSEMHISDLPESGPAPGPFSQVAPAEIIEGRTIKMQVPPPGTLKLLPGRFEVVKGDETVKELRFYKPKGVERPEITFGRAKGPNYSHVQLKPMTVSSRQAKLIFDGKTVNLINYASSSSNPTRINDREMAVEENVTLVPGDLICMGEIEFKYIAE